MRSNKIIAFIIAILTVFSVLSSCTPSAPYVPLTGEEILALPKSYLVDPFDEEWPKQGNLNQYHDRQAPVAAVTGQLDSVRYEISIEKTVEGYQAFLRVSRSFRIDAVDDPENGLGLKPGDLIPLLGIEGVSATEDQMLKWVNAHFGTKLQSRDELNNYGETHQWPQVQKFEVFPTKDDDLILSVDEERLFLLPDVTYRGVCEKLQGTEETHYTLSYPYDVSDADWLTTLQEEYGVKLETRVAVIIKQLMQTTPFIWKPEAS